MPTFAFASSGIEEQRKYIVAGDGQKQLLALVNGVGPFSFEQHSVYHVYDLYFDTSDRRLVRDGYSLRLRRVEKKEGKLEYALQLKSEMSRPGEMRLEVEWKDLLEEEAGEMRLPALVDRVIAQGEVRAPERKAFESWFAEKMGSAFAPFQELRRRGLGEGVYTPQVLGTQRRVRFHAYVDRRLVRGDLAALPSSERTKVDVPESFLKDRAKVWTMEVSIDSARFRSVKPGRTGAEHVIAEFDIENKYRPRATGTLLIDRLEGLLKERFPISDGQQSKYLQAVTALDPGNVPWP